MREPTKTSGYRHQLLTSVSAAVLLLSAYGSAQASGSDADRPQLWLELGGLLSRQDYSQEKVDVPWYAGLVASGLNSPLSLEKPPQYSIDEYGKLSFQPDGSDWIFSAAVRYGRSTNKNQVQQQTHPAPEIITGFYNSSPPPYYITITYVPPKARFANTQYSSSEKHTILDFQAGKDLGLGLFGGSSQIGLGLRFAQFTSRSRTDVNGDPSIHYPTQPIAFKYYLKYNNEESVYWEQDYTRRSFRGLGPAISWQGTAPIAGNSESAQLQIDWDVNAAVLFGRQRARGFHQSSNIHTNNGGGFGAPTSVGPYITHNRSRNVTVPNVGGSLGLSFKSGDAKVSFGYRADLFVNAMDTGIDARKTSNMLFHGPYASISIGLP